MHYLPMVIAAFAVTTQACSIVGPRLPGARPANFQVVHGYGGGMRDTGRVLHVSAEKSFYAERIGRVTNRINFTITQKELDDLYVVFRENSFLRIKVSDAFAHDKAGNSIRIRYGKKTQALHFGRIPRNSSARRT